MGGGFTIIDIERIIEDKENFPAIFLGRYSLDFKRAYKGVIYRLSGTKEVTEVVDQYSDLTTDDLMVFDNIGFLYDSAIRSLLKFIEEAQFPIALLSYSDRIPDVILSRMKQVFTKPVFKVGEFDFISVGNCLDNVIEQNLSDYDRIIEYSLSCPLAYYLEMSGTSFNRDKKILKVLGKMG